MLMRCNCVSQVDRAAVQHLWLRFMAVGFGKIEHHIVAQFFVVANHFHPSLLHKTAL